MSDSTEGPKIHIDSDWKTEAQQEKQRLAEQEAASDKSTGPGEVTFANVVNLLAMQAVVGLGGMQTPDGQKLPPDPQAARLYIDLLAVLEEKTKGNLSDDERKMLSQTLHELRMMFVQLVGPVGGAAPSPPGAQPNEGPQAG